MHEISTTENSIKINREYLECISRRGEELIQKVPELKSLMQSYIALQREECRIIDENIEGALWLIQKAGPTVVI
ncbi:MAG: hypothetical protein GF313_03250 [Caldithrix sp.]|nr:hypothetical protein [Caldithrix sp.]